MAIKKLYCQFISTVPKYYFLKNFDDSFETSNSSDMCFGSEIEQFFIKQKGYRGKD